MISKVLTYFEERCLINPHFPYLYDFSHLAKGITVLSDQLTKIIRTVFSF